MRWLWIDRIVVIEPGHRLVAVKHVSFSEEHLEDHFPAENNGETPPLAVMPASLIIEGAAQTAGILVAHARNFTEKVILAKINKATIELDAQPGDTIRFDACIQRIDDAGALARVLLAIAPPDAPAYPVQAGAIEILFSHIDKNLKGAEFPEHNFVFGESFDMLLKASGVSIPPNI